ncbi:hypothetical protein [Ruegeria sp. HKCCD8929]|uniref:hypothetical protein n=1 Tax=Ruegeria sp. HKCCD8929 TaxID=2683006 RepID=UPI001489C5C0|nr:hypothetical protein [Ruegeria sp. HKCCD8929]
MSDRKDGKTPATGRGEKAERMAEIRKSRREAGFVEMNNWVPQEWAQAVRDYCWKLIDQAGRPFPHRLTDGRARRDRRGK